MTTTYSHLVLVAATLALIPSASGNAEQPDTPVSWSADLRIGGCGGVYLLASPGPLWVDIEKQDLNVKGRHTHLRAILFGPDRRVIDEQWLADDGKTKGTGAGPVQRVRLATTVARKGIYGVNVTATEDRYGEDFLWGFRTNCPKYLVETSRGHRDARHQEPLVLRNPEAAGDVCFLPRRAEIAMEVTGLPPGVEKLTMHDAQGTLLAELPVNGGKAAHTFPADERRGAAPWRLRLPKFSGVVQIDGLTRWAERAGGTANLSLWTPRQESWFPFPENRWLLTPYSRVAYAEAGSEDSVTYQVHNNASVEKKLALSLEFPDEQPWQATLSSSEIALAPRRSAPVSVDYCVPTDGDAWTCHVRVTPEDAPGLSTYSTLELRRGTAPAKDPIPIPHVLEPYEHENEQSGYMPAYPLTNQVYFDMANRPAIAAGGGVTVWHDGAWAEVNEAVASDGKLERFRPVTSKVGFDSDNGMYLVGAEGGANVLLHSSDGGRSFTSYRIPGGGSFDIEQFSGHNQPDGPPPFIRVTRTAKDPNLMWRSLCDLHLFLPERNQDGTLNLGDPIMLSRKCIGISMHSGIPSNIVSRDGKVHVAWGEATDPEKKVPGVPTYVATYDRASGVLSEPALVGHGPPANDVHNTPCITMDSQGYLHVLVGTHGRTFKYARSLEPNDAATGWAEAEDIGPGLRQTYVGLVCDKDDALHLVFRLWRTDTTYFPSSSYATLAYMHKRPNEAWSQPRVLVVAPFSEYSIFYHRLTIDRAGALFLSYDYWSTFWFYRTDHRGTRRALLTSPDNGASWKLASLEDLTR